MVCFVCNRRTEMLAKREEVAWQREDMIHSREKELREMELILLERCYLLNESGLKNAGNKSSENSDDSHLENISQPVPVFLNTEKGSETQDKDRRECSLEMREKIIREKEILLSKETKILEEREMCLLEKANNVNRLEKIVGKELQNILIKWKTLDRRKNLLLSKEAALLEKEKYLCQKENNILIQYFNTLNYNMNSNKIEHGVDMELEEEIDACWGEGQMISERSKFRHYRKTPNAVTGKVGEQMEMAEEFHIKGNLKEKELIGESICIENMNEMKTTGRETQIGMLKQRDVVTEICNSKGFQKETEKSSHELNASDCTNLSFKETVNSPKTLKCDESRSHRRKHETNERSEVYSTAISDELGTNNTENHTEALINKEEKCKGHTTKYNLSDEQFIAQVQAFWEQLPLKPGMNERKGEENLFSPSQTLIVTSSGSTSPGATPSAVSTSTLADIPPTHTSPTISSSIVTPSEDISPSLFPPTSSPSTVTPPAVSPQADIPPTHTPPTISPFTVIPTEDILPSLFPLTASSTETPLTVSHLAQSASIVAPMAVCPPAGTPPSVSPPVSSLHIVSSSVSPPALVSSPSVSPPADTPPSISSSTNSPPTVSHSPEILGEVTNMNATQDDSKKNNEDCNNITEDSREKDFSSEVNSLSGYSESVVQQSCDKMSLSQAFETQLTSKNIVSVREPVIYQNILSSISPNNHSFTDIEQKTEENDITLKTFQDSNSLKTGRRETISPASSTSSIMSLTSSAGRRTPNTKRRPPRDALLKAIASNQHMEIIKLLEVKSISLEEKDCIGRSAFHLAVLIGNLDLVQRLKDMGANIWSCDYNGNSSLHTAVNINNIEMIALLLKLGLDPYVTDNKGKTVIRLAAESKNKSLFDVFVKSGHKK